MGGFHAPVFMAMPNEAPFTSTDQQANMVLRVILGTVGTMACIVPFRILNRNGEFAAVIFILSVIITNLEVIVFALIWRSDDMDTWWPGYGLCDVYPYIYNPCRGLFFTCLLAIMRNLAQQVGLLRVNPLSIKEKRRRVAIEALIIFPLPIAMMALTWPLTSQRYVIAGVKGCVWSAFPSWPYILFYMISPIVVGLVTTFYAVLTFIRFRQVSQTTMSALSSNRAATLRSQRAKRRLYLMVISILIPFLPVIIVLAGLTLKHTLPVLSYSWDAVHHHKGYAFFDFAPSWNTVIFMPYKGVVSPILNDSWVTIVTSVPIFVFFGLTKDAINEYRKGLLLVGLGRAWPGLHDEYDPDRKALRSGSLSASPHITPTIGWPMSRASNTAFQWTKSSSSGDSVSRSHLQSGAYLSTTHLEHSLIPEHASISTLSRKSSSGTDALGLRNPFPFRTRLNFSWPKDFSISAFKRKQAPEISQLPLHSRPSQHALMPSSTLPPLGNMGSDLALTSLTDDSTDHNKSVK